MPDFLLDIVDYLKYDVLKLSAPSFPQLDADNLAMEFQLHKEKKGYWISSTTHPAFLASGDSLEELRESIFDTLLIYYDVPRYHAKKLRDTLVMNLSDGRIVTPPQPMLSVQVQVT